MAKITSHFIKVEGRSLHVLEAGQGDPVLFLHGWPANAQLWRHVLEALGEHRRAIAIDLPGYGRSDKPLGVRYSFGFYERAIEGALAALDVERLGLCVHDVGGPLGLYWAVRHADRVDSLGLLNTLVFPERSWAVYAFVLATHVPGLKHWMSSPSGIAALMRLGMGKPERITDEIAQLYTAPFHDRAARRALLATVQSLSTRGMRSIDEGLSQLTMPLRIIYGERDRALPDVARTMKRVAERLPHAEITSLPNVGHFLQEDDTQRVTELVTEFFARPRREAAARPRS